MKLYIKRFVSLSIISILTIVLFLYFNSIFVLKRTDGITTMQNLYAQEDNTVDVLLLGSSHSGMNLDTEQLWSEYGIASYALWGSIQPFWNSYYFLLEALKTQTPEVVVLETYAAKDIMEYSDDARQITNTAGMKYNKNRLEAAIASTEGERIIDLFLGLPLYHQRYNELTQNDFMHFSWTPNLEDNKGTGNRYGVGNYDLVDVSDIDETAEIYPKQEKYLRKIIEICQQKDIPILLITTPTANRTDEQPYYNSVAKIADEYNVQYYNFNLMDKQTGLIKEDYWMDGHLNTEGARKISTYLGKILIDEYNVSNRKGDDEYNSWEKNATNIQNAYLAKITEKEDYVDELKRNGRTLIFVKNSSWEPTPEYEYVLDCFSQVGIDLEAVKNSTGGNWLLTNTQTGEFKNQYFGNMYSEFEYNNDVFSVDYQNGTGISVNGKTVYKLHGSGIICVVYDEATRTCVDTVEFLVADSFDLKHIK